MGWVEVIGSRRVFSLVRERRRHRLGNVRLVTSRGFIDSRIVGTVNSCLAGGCTRNLPNGHCCNKYRIISVMRGLTVRHIGGIFNTRCTGIRPRSNTRTGTTILLTMLGPNSAFVKLGLSRNNRLSRNDRIGASNVLCGPVNCGLGGRANHISCSRVRGLTLRRGPGLVVNNNDTCDHR